MCVRVLLLSSHLEIRSLCFLLQRPGLLAHVFPGTPLSPPLASLSGHWVTAASAARPALTWVLEVQTCAAIVVFSPGHRPNLGPFFVLKNELFMSSQLYVNSKICVNDCTQRLSVNIFILAERGWRPQLFQKVASPFHFCCCWVLELSACWVNAKTEVACSCLPPAHYVFWCHHRSMAQPRTLQARTWPIPPPSFLVLWWCFATWDFLTMQQKSRLLVLLQLRMERYL